MENDSWLKLLTVLMVIGLVLGIWGLFAISNIQVTVPDASISAKDKSDIATESAQLVLANLPASEPSETEVLDNDKLDILISELTINAEEAKAEELALAEIETRNFKRALQNHLNDNGSSIDSYKDIEVILVKDIEIDISGDDAEVELELKVSYFEDGDDDADDIVKAKTKVILEIKDLDEDEDFEDAEIVDYDKTAFSLIKFYD